MLLLTKTKGHMSNVHYSGFPKHLQTKSNLHISISQSKLKHKCLPLDTLYKTIYTVMAAGYEHTLHTAYLGISRKKIEPSFYDLKLFLRS